MIKKGAICAKEDKMKKLLATFAVTTLLVILAVSAVSCVYQPDADKVIDIDVLGEPIFVSEFVIDYVRCYDVDEIPFVK